MKRKRIEKKKIQQTPNPTAAQPNNPARPFPVLGPAAPRAQLTPHECAAPSPAPGPVRLASLHTCFGPAARTAAPTPSAVSVARPLLVTPGPPASALARFAARARPSLLSRPTQQHGARVRAPRPARSSSVTDPQARTSAAPLPFPFSLQRNAAAEITGEFAGIFIPLRPAEIPGTPYIWPLRPSFPHPRITAPPHEP